MKNSEYILLAGLALVFFWLGIWKFFDPIYWMGWMPIWMQGFLGISLETWTKIIGGGECVLAIAFFVPPVRFFAALLSALHLIGIIIMTGFSDIGVRDIGLLSIALYFTFTLWPIRHS